MILCMSVVSVVTSPFSFLILLIWVLSLSFLMSLAKDLTIFVHLFQETAFSFISTVSFVSVSFISVLIFLSFLLLTLDFIFSSFLSYFRCKIRLSLRFFLFTEISLHCYKLPSGSAFTVPQRFCIVMFLFSFGPFAFKVIIDSYVLTVTLLMVLGLFCSAVLFLSSSFSLLLSDFMFAFSLWFGFLSLLHECICYGYLSGSR